VLLAEGEVMTSMKRFIMLLALILLPILPGCGIGFEAGSSQPVTLTLWHNYGGQLKDTMDEMIDEFNETVGKKEGIIVSVTSISGSATLHEKLTMAAHGDPGAPSLPDITTVYPKTALILAEKGLLADLDEQFTRKELSAYIPQFIEEGRLADGGLYVFPIAKSTEVLFVNKTLFDRFSRDTGARIEDLQSFEGIIRTASLYYEWTDRQTPDIPNDGKMFYMPDSIFNLFLVGCRQLGAEFTADGQLNLNTPQHKKVWDFYFTPAVMGQVAVFDGYATDLAKTGDIVCSTGSTAGVSFFSPTVTYADNTSEPIELAILPYPVFEGGKKVAIQRGAGMSVIKSTREKEHLAGIFLKWFTSPENNMRFVSSTGYFPVTVEAFGERMSKEMEKITDPAVKNLLRVSRIMQKDYEFCIPPLFEGVDELEEQYKAQIMDAASRTRDAYVEFSRSMDSVTAYENASRGVYEDFILRFP
jgi:multiple sugar transport system substrate-binding protein